MSYNLKNILVGTALSLILSVSAADKVAAQLPATGGNENPGTVSLDLDNTANNQEIMPVLEDKTPENTAGTDMITPSAPAAKLGNAPMGNNADGGDDPLAPAMNNSDPLAPNMDNSDPLAPSMDKNAPILPDDETNAIINDPLQSPVAANAAAQLGQSKPQQPAPSGNRAIIPNTADTVDSIVRPGDDPLPDMAGLGGDEAGALGQIDTNLFSKMSTLEKQSALLSLELRREKIRNEIEAIKAQRQQAILEQQAAEEEKQRKKQEWENEQKRKLLVEEQKLKEIEAKIESLRQEKVIKAYKEEMLKEKQAWIKNNEKIYQEMAEIENDRQFLLNDFKMKLSNLRNLAAKAVVDAQNARDRHNRDVEALKTKISVLQSRLDAELAEKNKNNPFAQLPAEKQVMLSDVYAIMEVVGKGQNLAAKLINKNGDYFMVRKGTTLQTGHVIDEIAETYIRGDLNGAKDYLYFSAGGILDNEPVNNSVITKAKLAGAKSGAAEQGGDGTKGNLVGTAGIPSLGEGLFVR